MSIFSCIFPKPIKTKCTVPVTTSCSMGYGVCGSILSDRVAGEITKENRQRKINSVLYNTTYNEMTYDEWSKIQEAKERSDDNAK